MFESTSVPFELNILYGDLITIDPSALTFIYTSTYLSCNIFTYFEDAGSSSLIVYV